MLRLHPENVTAYDQALLSAAKRGDYIAMQRAMNMGASINAQDDAGLTPLMILVKNRDQLNFTALHFAVFGQVPGKVFTAPAFAPQINADFLDPFNPVLKNKNGQSLADMLAEWCEESPGYCKDILQDFIFVQKRREANNAVLRYFATQRWEQGWTSIESLLCEKADPDDCNKDGHSARALAEKNEDKTFLDVLHQHEDEEIFSLMKTSLRNGNPALVDIVLQSPLVTLKHFCNLSFIAEEREYCFLPEKKLREGHKECLAIFHRRFAEKMGKTPDHPLLAKNGKGALAQVFPLHANEGLA